MLSMTCNKCGVANPQTDEFFYRTTAKRGGGFVKSCKVCDRKASRVGAKKNRARSTIIVPKTKTCCECTRTLPSARFVSRPPALDGLSSRCNDCLLITRKENRCTKIGYYLESKYGGVPCLDCERTYTWIEMDFDHLDDEATKIGISRISLLKATPERVAQVEKELKGCDLICSNCHRVRTHSRYVAVRELRMLEAVKGKAA